jgi:branched-subunit amino acid permease
MSVFVHMGVYQGGRYLLLYLPGLVLPLGLGLHELYRRTRMALPYVLTAMCMPLLSILVWYHLWTYWNPKVQEMIERSMQ